MIGVLGLQGGFAEHVEVLHSFCPAGAVKVLRNGGDLSELHALVIPGGESTVMRTMLERDSRMHQGLMHLIHSERIPTLATCAGLILLADRVREEKDSRIEAGFLSGGSLDVTVVRNWYGRQGQSFSASLARSGTGALFIRAPHVEAVGPAACALDTVVFGAGVEEAVVAVGQGRVIGLCGHPELVGEAYWHKRALVKGGAE